MKASSDLRRHGLTIVVCGAAMVLAWSSGASFTLRLLAIMLMGLVLIALLAVRRSGDAPYRWVFGKDSEHDFRLIIDSIPGHVWFASADGKLEYLNQRVLDYSGSHIEDLVNEGWMKLIHPEDVGYTHKVWSHSVDTGDPFDIVYRLRRFDGTYRWFRTSAQALRDRSGRVLRWYGVDIDIDDRKKVEEALFSTQERLARASQIATVAELSASIAHEINQPLAAVVTNGHACQRWLSAKPPNVERARLAAERIIRDGNSAGEVLSRIRALFRQSAVTKALLDLNDVVAEVCSLLSSEALRRNIHVETDLEKDLPPTNADRVQVQQVMINLANNAVDAMDCVRDRDKLLLIRTRRDGQDMLRVEIHDEGVGLADAERIFDAFFTTKEKGMGMGLPICRSIIEAHNGQLWVTRNAGHGTTFSFTLPVHSSVAK